MSGVQHAWFTRDASQSPRLRSDLVYAAMFILEYTRSIRDTHYQLPFTAGQ